MLANVVIATLSAPGQVSMAGEIPLQVYDNHANAINDQIFGMNSAQRSDEESNVYGHVQFTRQEFQQAANTNALDNNLFTGTFGADVRYNDVLSLGAAVSFGGSNASSDGADIDGKEVLVSAYGVAHFGRGYFNAIASGGSSHIDVERHIVLGPTTRVEKGNTTATHTAFEIGGGFAFGSDDFNHGPFASLTWQKVDVQGYSEDGTDSTSMYFGDFGRKSTVGRLGYQVQATAGRFQPFGRVAFAKEGQDHVTSVQAGSNTMNGHFTLDGFQAASDWLEADLGFRYALNDATSVSFAYRARLSDETQDVNTVNLGFRKEFGAAAAPAPEPVVVAQTTCADLDDDADGVNTCDDKCPGSASGETVGPDGCPVPAAEPEPVQEAKPFRN
jgi:outer membrane lipase/esterase